MDTAAIFNAAPEILKLYWYQYFGFFFYALVIGVGLRYIRRAPGLGVKDVWKYMNEHTKDVLNSGLCWLITFTLWVTAPSWTQLLKWKWAYVLNHFYDWRYWSPIAAWLSDSIVGGLLELGTMLIDSVRGKFTKWFGKPGDPAAPAAPPVPKP